MDTHIEVNCNFNSINIHLARLALATVLYCAGGRGDILEMERAIDQAETFLHLFLARQAPDPDVKTEEAV